MSKTEPKKLKGIVSISSDDFFMNNKEKSEKRANNNNNKMVSPEPIKKTIKQKPISKPTPSSSSSRKIQLPDNFFEQILDCEFKLKEKFDIKTFYELINLYSSAINFYESQKDPKFITYNQSLNLLFSMPEVKKFMEGKKSLTKKEKINDIEKRMLQSEKKITKEKVNRIYLSKVQKNFGKNIINDEFNKQSNLFKKRKEEKKKKYLLSTSVLPHVQKQILNKDNNNNINKEKNNYKRIANKSCDIININNDETNSNDDSYIKIKKVYKTSAKKENPINLNFLGENNILDELRKEDLKNEINKITINSNENDSDKNNGDDTSSFTNSDNILVDITKMHRLTNKTLFQEKLKSNFDTYISEFYKIFLDKKLNSIIKDYTDSGNIIETKLISSSIEFLEQRRQMEFLHDENDGDENYNDQLESMIQQINDEEEESRMKIINEGIQREAKLNDKYINSINNFENHKLDMLKENLKLDVTKAVNSIVLNIK